MEQYIEFIGNHPMLSLAWIGLVFLIVSGWFKSKFSPIREINNQQLTLLVNREDALVVDTRTLKDYQNGHIAGAIHLSGDKAKEKDFSALEKHKSQPIILVCFSGISAKGVAANLHKDGYESVYVLTGGMSAWQNASLPVVSGR